MSGFSNPPAPSPSPPPSPPGEPVHVDIHVFIGSECVTIYKVPPGEYLIGREPSCHILVDAENVSRMHARLAFESHRLIIEDLQSANGTRIAGVPISLPTPIQNATEVHIGIARLLFSFTEENLSKIVDALSDPNLGLEPVRRELNQDPYLVFGTIAEGGMGLVVKARDQRIRRLVAMKVLRSGFEYAADKLMRFVSEAQLTGQLEHPNIVPVYQLGISAQGQTFYTMKYVAGHTLEEVLCNLLKADPVALKRYPLSALLTIFQKVGDAIAFAHSRGVVHRDLKPANIMIGSFGEVLVMDWGLAKRVNEGSLPHSLTPQASQNLPIDAPRQFQTLDGAVVGTPPYISPEQARGITTPNPLSDIHVLGSILYTILTLRPPIVLEPHQSLETLIEAVSHNRFTPIDEAILSPLEPGTPPPQITPLPQWNPSLRPHRGCRKGHARGPHSALPVR